MKPQIIVYVPGNGSVKCTFDTGEVSTIPKYKIVEIWTKFGGPFEKRLGDALHYADVNDTFLILRTFEKHAKDYISFFLPPNKGTDDN